MGQINDKFALRARALTWMLFGFWGGPSSHWTHQWRHLASEISRTKWICGGGRVSHGTNTMNTSPFHVASLFERWERDQPTSSLSPAHTATSLRDKCLVVCWVRMAGHTCPLITIARCAPLHCSGGPWILNRFAEHHANYFWRCAPCSSRRRQSNRCLGFHTWEKRETKKVNLSICSGCSVRHEEILDAPCLKLVFFAADVVVCVRKMRHLISYLF